LSEEVGFCSGAEAGAHTVMPMGSLFAIDGTISCHRAVDVSRSHLFLRFVIVRFVFLFFRIRPATLDEGFGVAATIVGVTYIVIFCPFVARFMTRTIIGAVVFPECQRRVCIFRVRVYRSLSTFAIVGRLPINGRLDGFRGRGYVARYEQSEQQ
jgi:hypothetical protein